MLEIKGFHKMSEQDNFENGCFGVCSDYYFPLEIVAKDKAELEQKIKYNLGDDVYIEWNACDEVGRIDASRTENDEGETPTESQLEQFKAGEIDLWYAVYTCYCDEVVRKPFDFNN